MSKISTRRFKGLALGLLGAALFASAGSALALSQFVKAWQEVYVTSTSDDADCSLCHGTANTNLNSYGKSLCDAFAGKLPADIKPYLRQIEADDSDREGSNNKAEIDANAQPGWTAGASNQIYAADVGAFCAAIGSPISPPSSVPLPYDPPASGEPVAIPGGPYTGNVNVPITFDGSRSYDSDGGAIASYTWSFGDGTTGTGMTPKHAYAAAGTYIVTLTVVDEESMSNTNSTTATISAAAVLDLDPVALKVTSATEVGKPITIQLQVNNPGPVLGQAIATVVGTQNGVEVYRWRLNVYDFPGGRVTSFTFPAYTPKAAGTINWAAAIADKDPDTDLVTAVTTVK
jgi:hypothetical protein